MSDGKTTMADGETTMPVLFGDGIEGLWSCERGSAGLILSDLPSGETRAAFDRQVDLQALWPAVWHALRPDGICVLLASSLTFSAKVLASQPDAYRYERIWRKTLPTGHLNARHRPLRAHEYVLVFWRLRGAYTPQMTTGHDPIHEAHRTSHGENYGALSRATDSRSGATDRYPTSVLDFVSVGTSSRDRVHPQQKPVPLLEDLIRTYSLPGDLVVDPFAGSGGVGKAAVRCDRRSAMWDNCPRFANLETPRALIR